MPTVFSPPALQREMNRRELTQTALSLMLNVTPAAVSQWLSGTTVPTTAMVGRIADALGVRVGRLFRRNGEPSAPASTSSRAA
jgi:transcriptional regulator with XRE-family HTH domain